MIPVKEHELRHALVGEAHARPFERLRAPMQASHIALLTGEADPAAERQSLADLCRRMGAAQPDSGASHFAADLGVFRCKWERHAEFYSFTFFREAPFEAPFDDSPIGLLPGDWLSALPGELLVACHVAMEPAGSGARSIGDLHAHFNPDSLAGSLMAGGNAEAWTDFRLHEDGFGRILVRDSGLRSRQAGRLVQRLLEIETYRTMALLALPLARDAGPEITAAATELSAITGRMPALAGLDDEQAMLDRLTKLAAGLEGLASRNTYRFSAAAAYYELVERRISGLREERIEGIQTIAEFMDRRMAPAMRTCQATAQRQERLSDRVARATALLRTRVDLAMEAQNRDLLRSMDRRARIQLRLQETVEGLSVAAISYYLVGLVRYAAKGIESAGIPLPVDLIAGLSIPVVVFLVWHAVGRIRRRLAREEETRAH